MSQKFLIWFECYHRGLKEISCLQTTKSKEYLKQTNIDILSRPLEY